MSVRKRVYSLVSPSLKRDDPNLWFDIFIIILISLNVIAIILESEEKIRVEFQKYFYWFEVFSVVVFTIEYLLRLWTYVEIDKYQHPLKGRLRWIFSPMALIDLLAILPFYLPFLGIDLRFLRILRLFRIFRIIKVARYSSAMRVLASVVKQKKEELIISLFFCGIMTVLCATMLYYAERSVQPEAFGSIPRAMWWSIITLTTVGYGDVYPITAFGKVMASMVAVLGIGLYALPTGILASGFSSALEQIKKK